MSLPYTLTEDTVARKLWLKYLGCKFGRRGNVAVLVGRCYSQMRASDRLHQRDLASFPQLFRMESLRGDYTRKNRQDRSIVLH